MTRDASILKHLFEREDSLVNELQEKKEDTFLGGNCLGNSITAPRKRAISHGLPPRRLSESEYPLIFQIRDLSEDDVARSSVRRIGADSAPG
jgi:hypothetical protein